MAGQGGTDGRRGIAARRSVAEQHRTHLLTAPWPRVMVQPVAEQNSDADWLLADLTDEQRDAVTTTVSPLCVLAGAGSGKTRVLTRRIAWQAASGNIDPRQVLAVTFTRRAAGELRKRLRALGLSDEVAAGTFHASALSMLRRYWADKGIRPPELIGDRKSLLRRLDPPSLQGPSRQRTREPSWDWDKLDEVDREIGWARVRLITPDRYPEAAGAAQRRTVLRGGPIAKAYRAYDKAKKRRRLIDFDDILALAQRVMRDEPAFAEAQRWQQRHLLIDEFQDVNPLQFELLKAWLGEESTLVVVGDPRQAIFGWNGADPELLAQIDRHLPGVATVELRTNFRSTPEILHTAATILDVKPQPAAQPHGEPPSVVAIADEEDEPLSIVNAVRRAHRPGALWRHQAVLARTNALLTGIREALVEDGIPVRTRDPKGLLRIPAVAELLGDYAAGDRLERLAADLKSEIAWVDPDGRNVFEHVLELARDALALDPAATVADFEDLLRTDDGPETLADGVDVTTFHQAKGLEWPIVHLVGVEDGFVPHYYGRSGPARQEEQRLLYVAATRAEQELYISWCAWRFRGGELREREPSPWIVNLSAAADDLEDASRRAAETRVAGIAGARAALEKGLAMATADPDGLLAPQTARRQAVFDELLDWRARAARNAKIEPQAVLRAEVVSRLAAQQPTSLQELVAVEGVTAQWARRFGTPVVEITGRHRRGR